MRFLRSPSLLVSMAVVVSVLGSVQPGNSSVANAGCPPDYSAEYVSGSPWLTMDPNATATVTQSWRNVGCLSWNISVVGSQAFAGTSNPDPGQDQSSPFGGANNPALCGTATGWYACNRIRPTNDIVAPGSIADFTFQVKAPPAPGTYKVHLRPVIEGVTWMEDFGVFWQATVRSTQGPSRYMASVDAATGGIVYIQGCKAGGDNAGLYGGPYTPQTGVVVLAFGRPSFNAGSQQYGSILFNDTFASTTQILAAAKAWAQGYWNCSPTSPTIRIALGTSNYGPEVTAAHGAAWAQMAKDLQSWIDTSGYSSQLSASGASDIEMDWNSPTISRNWACVMDGQGTCTGGFGSVTGVQYYNYGDAAGCPPFGSCNNGWSQEHVWYVSWGAPPSWPLPEIYNDAMAQQWYRISLYGYTQHGSRITIKGAMSQYAACQLTPGCPGGGTDFTQQQSWATLWKYITGDTRTRQSGGDEMRWSTDITKAQ